MRPMFRSVLVVLVAVVALSVVTATGASAETLPAFYQCAKTKKVGKPAKYVGHYGGKHCEESTYDAEGGQKYELEPWNEAGKGGAGKAKELKGKIGKLSFEFRGLGLVKCVKGRDTGEVTGPKTLGDIQVVLTGCELNKIQCHNTATAGEIVTNTLKGEIGYFDEVFGKPVARGVGLDLTPESGSGVVVGIDCSSLLLWVEGSVIGEIEPPYNVTTKEVKLKFEANYQQGIQSFEGMPSDTLFERPRCYCSPLETGLSGELTNKGEELELKA